MRVKELVGTVHLSNCIEEAEAQPTSGAASASVSGARPHRNPGGAVALAVELYGISFSSLSFFATAAVIESMTSVRESGLRVSDWPDQTRSLLATE